MFDKTKGDGAVVTSKFYSPNYKNCHLEQRSPQNALALSSTSILLSFRTYLLPSTSVSG